MSEREVVERTTVTVEKRTRLNRWHYLNMTEEQILHYERNRDIEEVLEDFTRDVEGTPTGKLIIDRTVEIVDK